MKTFVAALLSFIITIPTATVAQGLDIKLSKNQTEYASQLLEILSKWSNKKLVFEKNKISENEFKKKMDVYEARQKDNGLEKLIPGGFIWKNWESLPSKLESKLALSVGAEVSLIGNIIDATPFLVKLAIEPASLAKSLNLPLYLTLAAAQAEAQKAHSPTIDAIAIRRGGLWFFSFGWPFCCADVAAK